MMFGLSTEGERNLLDVRGGRLHDLATGGGAAGEGDFVHEHALGQGLADRGTGAQNKLRAAARESTLDT